jgi:hypothetical protein
MDDGKPYTIHSDTRITLSALAREMCRLHGMSERDMARHLLAQERLKASGQTQQEGQS